MKATNKNYLSVIILLYVIANTFMFFNDGWYWDDWCLSSHEGIVAICSGVGQPFMIPITSWMINLTVYPALMYHILTGVFEILSFCIFYKILLSLKMNQSNAFVITLFFALIPYNQVKITIACFLYSVGLFFFLLAVILFIAFVHKNNLFIRIISLVFFFLSFLTLPSTLVLSLSIFLIMAIVEQNQMIELNLEYFKKILSKLFRWTDFILIPFVFWMFRIVFLTPTGVYAASSYREFSINSILMVPINLILTFIKNFIGLGTITTSLITSNIYAGMLIVIFVVLIVLLIRFRIEPIFDNTSILYLGLYLFLAGSFAYNMVGLLPVFDDYSSRHQILLKIGSSFILFYLLDLIKIQKAQKIILVAIISLFIISTISRQLQFQKSWFKQSALEKEFPKEKLLTEGSNFVVVDNTIDYNEFNVNYAFYCYTGILKKSFGTQTRFAVDSRGLSDILKINPQSLIDNLFYHMKDCKNISSFNYSLIINPGTKILSNPQSLKMLYQYYLNKVSFNNSLNEILSIHTEPYDSANY